MPCPPIIPTWQRGDNSKCQPAQVVYALRCDVDTIDCYLMPVLTFQDAGRRLFALNEERPGPEASSRVKLAWCEAIAIQISRALWCVNMRFVAWPGDDALSGGGRVPFPQARMVWSQLQTEARKLGVDPQYGMFAVMPLHPIVTVERNVPPNVDFRSTHSMGHPVGISESHWWNYPSDRDRALHVFDLTGAKAFKTQAYRRTGSESGAPPRTSAAYVGARNDGVVASADLNVQFLSAWARDLMSTDLQVLAIDGWRRWANAYEPYVMRRDVQMTPEELAELQRKASEAHQLAEYNRMARIGYGITTTATAVAVKMGIGASAGPVGAIIVTTLAFMRFLVKRFSAVGGYDCPPVPFLRVTPEGACAGVVAAPGIAPSSVIAQTKAVITSPPPPEGGYAKPAALPALVPTPVAVVGGAAAGVALVALWRWLM